MLLTAQSAFATNAAPKRVVSMNVCTDQFAMLIAAPGQLRSVSFLATHPETSAMAAEAASYPANQGFAEEIHLMRPDLVLAGTYTTRATVSLLRRLGIPVAEFAPEASFDDVRANLRRMGDLLGRRDRAEELVARLDAGLAELARSKPADATVATYSSDAYTAGPGSLAAAVIDAAGLETLGARLGIVGSGRLPLEVLVLNAPDLVVAGALDAEIATPDRQRLAHPAFRALLDTTAVADVPDAWWICGGFYSVAAARLLQAALPTAPKR